MGNKTSISILVPIYNVEAYLRRCVESVLCQDFNDYELILVDDGSSDGCGDICDEYAQKFENIKAVHKENGGLVSARREGVRHANGKYYMFLDSDDWLESGALSILYHLIIKGYDMVKACAQRVTPNGDVLPLERYAIEEGEVNGAQDFLEYIYMGRTAPYLWGALYRADLFNDEVFNESIENNISLGEDALTNMIVGLKIKKALYVKDVVYNYFFNPKSIMSTKSVSAEYGERMQSLIRRRVFVDNPYLLDLQTARRASYTFRNCFIPEKGFSPNYDRDLKLLNDSRFHDKIVNCLDSKYLYFVNCKPLYMLYSFIYRTAYKYVKQKGTLKNELK